MGFVKSAAKVGLFGLPGLIASGAFKDKKKDQPKSLVSGDYPTQPDSLIHKSIY